MSERAKRAVISALGGIGVILFLLGPLGHVYATTTGLLIALGCWIACGVLSKYWGLRKEDES
ncbi:hypothetical protein ACFLUH_00595 [Chloroflexota bacterium]